MMIGMSFDGIVKTQGASWLFVYKTGIPINLIDPFCVYSSFGVKQAQITFNLFHFSRHRVPFIQDERKGSMRSRVV